MKQALDIEAFYHVFRDISTAVHSSTNVEEILDLVVWKATETLGAKGAILRILNLETDQLELSAAHGLGERYLSKGVVSSHKVITDICLRNQVIVIDDVLKDPRIQYPNEAWAEGIRLVLDLPLSIGDRIAGILRIYFPETRELLKEELDFMVTIAQTCSCAIDKARLIEKQQAKYNNLALRTEKLSALGRMAAGIAHEINNPLAGVLLYGSNLLKKVPAKGPLRESLDVIIQETIRCKTIVQDLLEFSRERQPKKTRANINDIIRKTVNILQNEFRLNRIELTQDLPDNLPKTLIDENQMEQVFINILLNAVEAIQENGKIRVESRTDLARKRIVVEIEDNGCGLSPEQLEQIFEPFFSTKPNGTGLGLAVSYGIIKNHQGDMEVSSQPENGSRFTITIPIC